jgi:tetratricopeptide (TPR) repeat protein
MPDQTPRQDVLSMWTILVVAIAVSLCLYYLIWYRAHRGQRQIARGRQTLNALGEVQSSYRAGEYQTALEQAEGLKHGFSKTPEYCFFRGTMLHQLGKFAEAEASLREGILLESDVHRKALASNTLGTILMDMKRYPEALACFEEAIRIWPERGSGHSKIAELWLRQGRDPVAALHRAQRALEVDRAASGLSSEIRNLRIGEDSALLAWALAANSGSAQQVESLLAEAFPLCANSAKTIQAQLHFHAGKTYSALHMPEKSASHFSEAAKADPKGQFGRMATALLATRTA